MVALRLESADGNYRLYDLEANRLGRDSVRLQLLESVHWPLASSALLL